MTNTRKAIYGIPSNSSFPIGIEGQIVSPEEYFTDGTVSDGMLVSEDTTTTNELVTATSASTALGVLIYDPAWKDSSGNPIAKGTAPASASWAKVGLHGVFCVRCDFDADNLMGGTLLSVGASGMAAPRAIAACVSTIVVGKLLDQRGHNDSDTDEHVVFLY